MLIVTSVGGAYGLMVAGLILLGTWPVIWAVIEGRGRRPSHTFLDYAITYLLSAVVLAFTLGQVGSSQPGIPNIATQLGQPNAPLAAFALAGGAALAVGDVCMMFSVALLGLAVGPAAMNAISIVVGTTLNYFLDGGLNNAAILFPGVAAAAVATVMGAAAHERCRRDHKEANAKLLVAEASGGGLWSKEAGRPSQSSDKSESLDAGVPEMDDTEEATSMAAADDSKHRRGVTVANHGRRYIGLAVAGGGGLVYAFFAPAFNVATNDNFRLLASGVPPLSMYATDFYFSIGFTAISVVLNVIFLYRPPLRTAPSTIGTWLADNDGRLLSMLAGLLACLGDMTQFLAGQAVGYAAASVVQAYPLVSTICGIAFFREFRGVSRSARLLLAAQIGFYIAAIGLLAASARSRISAT